MPAGSCATASGNFHGWLNLNLSSLELADKHRPAAAAQELEAQGRAGPQRISGEIRMGWPCLDAVQSRLVAAQEGRVAVTVMRVCESSAGSAFCIFGR
jgi:hypothetical protein